MGIIGHWLQQVQWFFNDIEQAQSTDFEKIIKIWEGDTYQYVTGRIIKMRPCDHKGIQGVRIGEFVAPAEQTVSMNIPPYYWLKQTSAVELSWEIPAKRFFPQSTRSGIVARARKIGETSRLNGGYGIMPKSV